VIIQWHSLLCIVRVHIVDWSHKSLDLGRLSHLRKQSAGLWKLRIRVTGHESFHPRGGCLLSSAYAGIKFKSWRVCAFSSGEDEFAESIVLSNPTSCRYRLLTPDCPHIACLFLEDL
jgi:hypothetical protein